MGAEAVGEVATHVATRHPDRFIGAVMPDDPSKPPELYIKGVPGPDIHELVEASPAEIRIVDGQPYSRHELQERQQRVADALVAQGFDDLGIGFDLTARGVIEATVTATPEAESDTVDEVSARVPADLRDDVVVRIEDQPVGENLAAFGGMWMRDGPTNLCTSGWSVAASGGATGVTTAGHCQGINRIVVPGTGAVATTRQGDTDGAWGDVEWHTTGHAEPHSFYYSSNQTRTVRSVITAAGIGQNQLVCVYGRRSNATDCSMRVAKLDYTCVINNVYTSHLVRMDRLNNLMGGDSGGPWFVGTRAYGSTKGNCVGRATFSVADYYAEAMEAISKPPIHVMARDRQVPRQTMTAGESIKSSNNTYTLVMQSDGNLVLYRTGVGAVWATSWVGVPNLAGSRATMQPDGNFVLYRPNGTAGWSTGTNGRPGSQIVLQTDGNLVVYDRNWIARWASGTAGA